MTLLADKEVPARVGALRAIGDSGDVAGALLLRLKALVGDTDVEVAGECFAALLRLSPAVSSMEFVAGFLGAASEEIRERAALALGESHLPAAFPVLRDAWSATAQAERRRVLLLSMAMLRLDEAVEFLLARVAEDRERAAVDALAALALYGRDESVRKRVEEIVGKRGSEDLRKALEREFRT